MDQCFDLGFHSEGAFTFNSAYELPVNLRSYFYAKLRRILEEREKANQDVLNKNKGKGR